MHYVSFFETTINLFLKTALISVEKYELVATSAMVKPIKSFLELNVHGMGRLLLENGCSMSSINFYKFILKYNHFHCFGNTFLL